MTLAYKNLLHQKIMHYFSGRAFRVANTITIDGMLNARTHESYFEARISHIEIDDNFIRVEYWVMAAQTNGSPFPTVQFQDEYLRYMRSTLQKYFGEIGQVITMHRR